MRYWVCPIKRILSFSYNLILEMSTFKIYIEPKLTRLNLYLIRFTPDPTFTQTLNRIPPDPN